MLHCRLLWLWTACNIGYVLQYSPILGGSGGDEGVSEGCEGVGEGREGEGMREEMAEEEGEGMGEEMTEEEGRAGGADGRRKDTKTATISHK